MLKKYLSKISVKPYYIISAIVWYLTFKTIVPVLIYTLLSPYGGPYLTLLTIPAFMICFIAKIIIDAKYDNMRIRKRTNTITWLVVCLTFAIGFSSMFLKK